VRPHDVCVVACDRGTRFATPGQRLIVEGHHAVMENKLDEDVGRIANAHPNGPSNHKWLKVELRGQLRGWLPHWEHEWQLR